MCDKLDGIYRQVDRGWSFARIDLLAAEKADLGKGPLDPCYNWYKKVRGKPLSGLEVGDLCRAVRQRLHLPATTQEVLVRLALTLFAGDQHPEELVAAYGEALPAYFAAWKDQARSLVGYGRRVLSTPRSEWPSGMDEKLFAKVSRDVSAWLELAGRGTPGKLGLTVSMRGQPPMVLWLDDLVEVSIGSAPDCRICLPQPDSGLARRHAVLRRTDAGFSLDLLVRSGTVNGEPIRPPCNLEPGDELVLGNVHLRMS